MARFQLALNVDDLEESIDFWTKTLGTGPRKIEPGYANFAVADPPLKLVLNEIKGQGGTINHMGVEVETTEEVQAAHGRLTGEDMATRTEDGVNCCFAIQDKVWVTTPDGHGVEFYTVLEDLGEGCGCDSTPAPVETAEEPVAVGAVSVCDPGCC